MNMDGFKKFDLTGKTALVTGGGTGLGYEMSRALIQSGAKVMIAARREDVLKSAAERLMAENVGTTVLWHGADMVDRQSVKALADHALATLNGVDIFIGNAGVEVNEPIDDISDESLDRQIRGNVSANVELTRALLPHMRKKKWGRFIYSSSAASEAADCSLMSIYGTTKSALNSFARYVAAEGGMDGITANSLVIGAFLNTGMSAPHLAILTEEQRNQFMKKLTSMIFLRRDGRNEEIGGLVQLLASDAGSYITGACIPIDGGITAAFRPVFD